jgi:hypothetical protein
VSASDWVSVGQYSDYTSALLNSQRLSDEGIPNRIWSPPRSPGESYIWVPPEFADAAKRILDQPAVPETELTALALQDPPPDDFDTPETEQSKGFAEAPARSNWLLLTGLISVGLLAALVMYHPKIQTHEAENRRSPDGSAEAVLIEIPRDALGAHSYKVCLRRANGLPLALSNCAEVAYLAGVGTKGVAQPVTLMWTSSSELEIRYLSANSIQIYKTAVVFGSQRYTTGAPIFVRLVHMGEQSGEANAH